jgi:hypothetical protein
MAVTSSRFLRVFWAVFMAVMGILCVPRGAFAARGQARAAEMFRQGCCCVTKPASGCCCETTTPLRLDAPVTASVDGLLASVSAIERADESRLGSCPCGLSEPASPSSKSSQNSIERETNSGATLSLEAFLVPERSAPPFDRYVFSRGSPLRSPLYLRNSRLLI